MLKSNNCHFLKHCPWYLFQWHNGTKTLLEMYKPKDEPLHSQLL